jgi:CheY-like chemotaxis protein
VAGSVLEEKRRILIVDDDQDSTHLIKILLEKISHYLVLEENDAAKAHESARDFRPDLILLDIMMPQIDGGDIAAQIDADPDYRERPSSFSPLWSRKPRQRLASTFRGILCWRSRSIFLS